jgi:signal transduction histidine kinase
MIKPGNDEFVNIENRMLNFANELCVPAGINFEFNKNTSADDIKIPMEMRRDIYLIFKEAINNAVKYSGCKNIRANISLMQNQLHLRIEDDGNGFDINAAKKGNGLNNMQKRTDDNKGIFKIKSSLEEGTEVVISFKT